MYLKEMQWDDVYWIHLAQNRSKQRGLVNTITDLLVRQHAVKNYQHFTDSTPPSLHVRIKNNLFPKRPDERATCPTYPIIHLITQYNLVNSTKTTDFLITQFSGFASHFRFTILHYKTTTVTFTLITEIN